MSFNCFDLAFFQKGCVRCRQQHHHITRSHLPSVSRSQTSRKFNQRASRRTQGLFTCKTCDEENADRNAAFNRLPGFGYISKVGNCEHAHNSC